MIWGRWDSHRDRIHYGRGRKVHLWSVWNRVRHLIQSRVLGQRRPYTTATPSTPPPTDERNGR